jgi:hypothetical protein
VGRFLIHTDLRATHLLELKINQRRAQKGIQSQGSAIALSDKKNHKGTALNMIKFKNYQVYRPVSFTKFWATDLRIQGEPKKRNFEREIVTKETNLSP